MKKRLFLILLVLLLVSDLAVPAFAVVEKSEKFYVADYANVISESIEDELVKVNGDLEYYCDGAQLVVVTVDYLDGMYSDEYAMRLFNTWGVGGKSSNGMLLLLAPQENKAWLTIGAGINGSFSDSMASQYLDSYFWKDFDNGDYEIAVVKLCNALLRWYSDYYGLDIDASDGSGGESNAEMPAVDDGARRMRGTSRTGLIILVVIIIYIVISSDRRRYRAYHSYMGIPMPAYHWWFIFGSRPYRHWRDPHWNSGGGPHGPGPGNGSSGGFGGNNHHSSGGGNHFGGFGGSSGGGHFGGFGGGGHVGGGFGGGGFGGGGAGRR